MIMEIKPNRKEFPWGIVIGIMVCLLFYILIEKPEGGISGYYAAFTIVMLFVYAALYTILAIYSYLRRQFSKKSVLIVSDEELYDNISLFSCGRVLRRDILDAQILRVNGRKVLVIRVADNERYLSNKNFLKQYVLKMYTKRYNTPIVIFDRMIDYDLVKLRDLILNQ